jgi:hypothetical protein
MQPPNADRPGSDPGSKSAPRSAPRSRPTNEEIAEVLERIADLLEVQEAESHRVRAYRNAARSVRIQPDPIAARVPAAVGGSDDLESLPGIGKSIAASIRELVRRGRLGFLERLEGQVSPADLFTTVPGIGDELAHRIESQLHLETLEDLEAAAADGRLETVPGIGRRRARGVRESLGHMLRFAATRRARGRIPDAEGDSSSDRPPVALLLEVDREYRERAGRDELRKIAPRRFNPEHRAWLPVLHLERAGWSITALFSNTARAHELGRTDDWVVLYFERDGIEGQCTVVTERSGPAKGLRVVRGREAESMRAQPRS